MARLCIFAFVVSICEVGASKPQHKLLKTGYECASKDIALGTYGVDSDFQPSLDKCAEACQKTPDCAFFIYGQDGDPNYPDTTLKKNRCYAEFPTSAACEEGWEADEYNYYQLQNPGVVGCMEPRAFNYNATATIPSQCDASDTCAHHLKDGSCYSCFPQQCKEGNVGYRNKHHDTVTASKVSKDAITVDGDLRDWENHLTSRTYTNVAFANKTGHEVLVEMHQGGTWYGVKDFSITWRLAWDEDYFYLAADVTDDILVVTDTCWMNGLQVGFEVGGPKSEHTGELQGKRSKSLDESRLRLINAGLKIGQTSCSTDNPDRTACCVDYELNNGDQDWLRKTKVAVVRNDVNKRTIIEAAFHNGDLVGTSRKRWAKGLKFGFSFVINDGDDRAEQQGWGGFYPHSLVIGWEDGQKQPFKVGLVELGGAEKLTKVPEGGSGAMVFFFGLLLGIGSTFGVLFARRKGYCGGTKPAAPPRRSHVAPMASADYQNTYNSPSLTSAQPMEDSLNYNSNPAFNPEI